MKQHAWIVVVLALASPACGKKLVNVQLTPSKVQTTIDQDHGEGSAACAGPCGVQILTGCILENQKFFPDPNSVMVGYAGAYDPGTSPCNCWAWRACAFRGYVAFDLGSLPSTDVFGASLKWHTKMEKNEGGVAINDGTCLKDLYVAQAPWTSGKIPGDALVITGKLGPVDVGNQVRQWAKKQLPNYGFFMVGPKESLPGKSHDYCRSQLSSFVLEVTVTVPK